MATANDDVLNEDLIARDMAREIESDARFLRRHPSPDPESIGVRPEDVVLVTAREIGLAILEQAAVLKVPTGKVTFTFGHPWSAAQRLFMENLLVKLRTLPVGCPAVLFLNSRIEVPRDFGLATLESKNRIYRMCIARHASINPRRVIVRIESLIHYWLHRDSGLKKRKLSLVSR